MSTAKTDVTRLVTKFNFLEQAIADELEVMIIQAAEIGAETARKSLDLAVTPYGLKRFSAGQGNSAGRNDTGSMIEDLKAFKPRVTKQKVEVEFGWKGNGDKKYYKFQEEGTSKIRGAFSLMDGKRAVLNALPRLEKNMKARVSRKMKGK